MKSFRVLIPVLTLSIALSTLITPSHSHAEDAYPSFAPAPRARKVRRTLASSPTKISTESRSHDTQVDSEQTGTGLAVFLGAGGGFTSITGNADQGEFAKNGGALLGRVSASLYNDMGVLDLGVGWIHTRTRGTATLVNGNSRQDSDATLLTRAGSLDFSPRLKFANFLEAGPVASILFGSDSGFGDAHLGVSSPVFAGVKGAMAFATHKLQFRITAQALTSLTIPNRSVYMAQGAFEIGIPLISGKTVIRETETETTRDNYHREVVETERVVVHNITHTVRVPVIQIKEVPVVKELMVFSFDDQIVNFEFDHSQLTPESKLFVQQLGQYLAANPDLWGSLRVEGHTDSRGTTEYNQSLSESRAGSVMRMLADSGIPSDRLQFKGYGKTRPLDSGESDLSRARNRRVEMSFTQVSDTRKLRDAITQIKLRNTHPSTCTVASCR